MKSHFSLAPPRLLSPRQNKFRIIRGNFSLILFEKLPLIHSTVPPLPEKSLHSKLFSGAPLFVEQTFFGAPLCFHRGTHLSFLCLAKVVANDTGHALTRIRGDRIIGNKTRASIARLRLSKKSVGPRVEKILKNRLLFFSSRKASCALKKIKYFESRKTAQLCGFALFVFCSGAVPLYGTASQNTKSNSPFWQSVSVSGCIICCRYTFFDTLGRALLAC